MGILPAPILGARKRLLGETRIEPLRLGEARIGKVGLVIAWVLISWWFLGAVLGILGTEGSGIKLKSDLAGTLYLPLAVTAWTAMVAYGAATVVGKRLERRENK